MSDDATPEPEPRLIDVSPALHIAGHEAELLGFEDVADTGPLVHDGAGEDDDPDGTARHHLGSDIATRGAGHAD